VEDQCAAEKASRYWLSCRLILSTCVLYVSVSGLHARLEKRDGQLYVTDLDSTNGTYVDNKQIRPGAVTLVSPGSNVTFG